MLIYYLFTNIGGRAINEDSIGMVSYGEKTVFLLADGLGGHGQGEVASSLVIEEGKKFIDSLDPIECDLMNIFDSGQARLLEKQKRDNALNKMKTTLVALEIENQFAQWGHVGDSRVYQFSHNKVKKRTLDHSVPQMLVQSRQIKESEIRHHVDRNRLIRVMGTEWEVPKYEISKAVKLNNHMSFLLCSDGFWELIEERDMCRCLKEATSPQDWIEQMQQIILQNGGETEMDNYSAIAIWIRKD